MKTPKVCIVSTICDAQNIIKTFVDYHISIGFANIFLFIDKLEELNDYLYLKSEKISLIPYDNSLIKKWLKTPTVRKHLGFVNKEVMARQCMNVEVAISMAKEADYDWILHIDSDELFYLDKKNNKLSDYFVNKSQFEQISFINHEAIPESAQINNFFQEVNLFKRNLECLSEEKKEVALEIFKQKNTYFRFYDNGKAAGNLKYNLISFGPHLFGGVQKNYYEKESYILHYPCCGYEFFKKKYQTLGKFDDNWYGKNNIKNLLPFHIESRDVVLNHTDDCKTFYKKNFMFENPAQKSELIEKGIFFRQNLITL